MDLLKEKPKKLFYQYFLAAFGSAMITSIYGIVDMAMVGHYHGPIGSAAMAVVAPVWNIIYSLGLLAGIGASVLYANARGQRREDSNQYFTTSLIISAILSLFCWLGILFASEPLLMLFGADEATLPLAMRYLRFVKYTVPVFLFSQTLSAFLRNDGAPGLATLAVVCGGVFNIVGDWFFVFHVDMGIDGAGLATALCALVSDLIMLAHFFSPKNTLRLESPKRLAKKSGEILITGFSSFFIDLAMGILTTIFNRQIMRYFDTDALAVYSVLVNLSTLVQCCAYSIGQAAQPILSVNFGAGEKRRVRETLHWAVITAFAFGAVWTVLMLLMPNTFIRLYMTPTESVLAIAPHIMRAYGLSFLLLTFNVFATYYFQAVLKPGVSFIISVGRGLVISGVLLYALPVIAGANAIWFVMLITEMAVTIYAAAHMRRETFILSTNKTI